MNFQFQLHEDALRLLRSKNIIVSSQSLPKPRTCLDPEDGPDDIKLTFEPYELWIYQDGANVLGFSFVLCFVFFDFEDIGHLRQYVLTFLDRLKGSWSFEV